MRTRVDVSTDGEKFIPSSNVEAPACVRVSSEVALAHFLANKLGDPDAFHLLTLIHMHKRVRFQQSLAGRVITWTKAHMPNRPRVVEEVEVQ